MQLSRNCCFATTLYVFWKQSLVCCAVMSRHEEDPEASKEPARIRVGAGPRHRLSRWLNG